MLVVNLFRLYLPTKYLFVSKCLTLILFHAFLQTYYIVYLKDRSLVQRNKFDKCYWYFLTARKFPVNLPSANKTDSVGERLDGRLPTCSYSLLQMSIVFVLSKRIWLFFKSMCINCFLLSVLLKSLRELLLFGYCHVNSFEALKKYIHWITVS